MQNLLEILIVFFTGFGLGIAGSWWAIKQTNEDWEAEDEPIISISASDA